MTWTDGKEWGCPRLSKHGAGWLIDWFTFDGIHTGSSRADRASVAWIESHPAEVAEMQQQCAEWFQRELDKVIPF